MIQDHRIERFGDEIRRAMFVGAGNRLHIVEPRHDQNGHAAPRQSAQLRAGRKPVETRQHHIQHHDVRTGRGKQRRRLLPALRLANLQPGQFERLAHDRPTLVVAIDHEASGAIRSPCNSIQYPMPTSASNILAAIDRQDCRCPS